MFCHLPDYLEFENLGDAVSFTLTTTLTPASVPFQPIAVGNGPDSIVAGDFTGDGRTDLTVANQDDNDVSVLLSKRRRHLPEPGHLRGGEQPRRDRGGGFERQSYVELETASGPREGAR